MSTFQYVLVFSIVGSLLSLVGALLILSKTTCSQKFATYATPFAAGALLAAVFFDLLPEGVELAPPDTVFRSAIIGILTFFVVERGLHFFHHHRHGVQHDADPRRYLVIVGDTLHNAIDGVVIAAGFLVSIPTGIATTIAVVAHEIPQEIGDFGLLLSKGMKKGKVIAVNVLSAGAAVVFALVTYWVGSSDQLPLGVLLGVSAGFLLYIAMSDIIPSLLAHTKKRSIIDLQTALLFLGVLVVGFIVTLAHDFVPHEGHHDSHDSSLQHRDETPKEDVDKHHNDTSLCIVNSLLQ